MLGDDYHPGKLVLFPLVSGWEALDQTYPLEYVEEPWEKIGVRNGLKVLSTGREEVSYTYTVLLDCIVWHSNILE